MTGTGKLPASALFQFSLRDPNHAVRAVRVLRREHAEFVSILLEPQFFPVVRIPDAHDRVFDVVEDLPVARFQSVDEQSPSEKAG